MGTAAMTDGNGDEWLSFQAAGSREGVSRYVVARLAREARVAVRRVPGGKPRVLLGDLRRVLAESTRPATVA